MGSRKTFDTLERHLRRIYRQADIDISKLNKKALADLKVTLGDIYEQYGQDSEKLFEEMQKYKRMGKMENHASKVLTGLTVGGIKIVSRSLKEIYTDVYKTTLKDIRDSTGLRGIQKDLKTYEVTNQMNMGTVWNKRLKNYSDAEINKMLTRIREGMYKGDSYQRMAKELGIDLDKNFDNMMRVVRTEGARVKSEAQQEVIDSFSTAKNLTIYKTWRTVGDERVRSTHSDLDGTEIESTEKFMMPDGSEQMLPALGSSASENINCRCGVALDYKFKESDNSL